MVIFIFTMNVTLNPYPRSSFFFCLFFNFLFSFFFTLVQKWPLVQNCHSCKIYTWCKFVFVRKYLRVNLSSYNLVPSCNLVTSCKLVPSYNFVFVQFWPVPWIYRYDKYKLDCFRQNLSQTNNILLENTKIKLNLEKS